MMAVDLDVGVPAGIRFTASRAATGSITDRITAKSHRNATDIANGDGLFLEKLMLTVRGHEREFSVIPQVLQVGLPSLFASLATCIGDRDAILPQQLFIDFHCRLVSWNLPPHVKPISMPKVAAGNLLDEAFNRNRDIAVAHT
jgi:hypothetical protein